MAGDAVLVVGLGNPGPRYEATRHNVGSFVVDELCDRLDVGLRGLKGVRATVAETHDGDHRMIIARPTTFMNESGEAAGPLARYFKVDAADLIVVHDDIDLPLGTIRVKRGGGEGGHNGLRSITRSLKTPDYIRVRIGVGRPHGRRRAADHVLRSFAKSEEQEVAIAVREAADAVLLVVREGLEAAQQRYHASPQDEKQPPRAIRTEVVVPASPEEVFDVWTTEEGVTSFFAPAARVELAPRGAYELFFDPAAPEGERGSEGCTIVAFERPRFLVFTWNAPPSIPSVRRARKTRVELRFAPADGGTRLTLAHTGWRDGEDWDKAFAYFERAWDVVLGRLVRGFRDGPVDWDER